MNNSHNIVFYTSLVPPSISVLFSVQHWKGRRNLGMRLFCTTCSLFPRPRPQGGKGSGIHVHQAPESVQCIPDPFPPWRRGLGTRLYYMLLAKCTCTRMCFILLCWSTFPAVRSCRGGGVSFYPSHWHPVPTSRSWMKTLLWTADGDSDGVRQV